jgi:hypothetical protein
MRQIKTATIFSEFDTSKRLFTLMLVVIVTVVVDSQIGYIADFIPEQLSSNGGISVFVVFAAVFAITQYLILAYVKKSNRETRQREPHLRILHTVVSVAQYLLVAVITLVSLQVLLTQQYNVITLYVTHAISYGLWIVTLALLAKAFFSWYISSNKNVMVLILALSMIAYVVNGVTGLATYFDMIAQQKPVVTSTDVAYFPEFSIESVGSQIGMANQIASTAAYILTWIGTVKMLYPYIKKLGKIKFWIIMSAAMVYYLISYPLFVLGYFTPSANMDAMTNVLIFSAFSGILSGIIFGAAFLSVARTLRKHSALRNHMTIAAYGFLLFYTAGSAMAAQAAYPPYGIVSVSFTGLSCYLIYTGLYSSAVTVSQDTTLRVSIKKSLNEQAKFLHSMGAARMEQELQSTVLKIAKKHSDEMTEKTGVEISMTDSDIKEYMAMVLNEIHS